MPTFRLKITFFPVINKVQSQLFLYTLQRLHEKHFVNQRQPDHCSYTSS